MNLGETHNNYEKCTAFRKKKWLRKYGENHKKFLDGFCINFIENIFENVFNLQFCCATDSHV